MLRRTNAVSSAVNDEAAFQGAYAMTGFVDLVAQFRNASATLVELVQRGTWRADAVALLVPDVSLLE